MVRQGKYTYFLRRHQAQNILCFITLLFVFPSGVLFSAGERTGRGTRAVGMANAFTAVADGVWTTYYNAAGLAAIHSLDVSGFIIPNQFGLSELRTTALACTIPFRSVTLGICADRFGFELYNELGIRAGIGFAADSIFLLGCSAEFYRVTIEHYGAAQAATFNLSLLGFLMQNFRVGCHLRIDSNGRIYCSKRSIRMSKRSQISIRNSTHILMNYRDY